MSNPREIWHLCDGKPGHVNQVRGLINAIGKQTTVNVHRIDVPSRCRSLYHWMRGVFPPGQALPNPDLLIAAGNATHLALLAARRARGGKAIVMMSPQLPVGWFDLCIVPEHDGVKPRANVLLTHGALNHIEPSQSQSPRRGLILIGGPSKNYGWSASALTEQVCAVVMRDAEIHWTLTTSRRTPAGYSQELIDLALPNLGVVPVEKTSKDWVGQRMNECGKVWVTEDSVSMVYEALTSGASVGLLAMPRGRSGRFLRPGKARVMAGLDKLAQDQMITTFEAWRATGELRKPAVRIDEAGRCAQVVIEKWLR